MSDAKVQAPESPESPTQRRTSRALWPAPYVAPSSGYVAALEGEAVQRWIAQAAPLAMATLVVRLRALSAPDMAPVVDAPAARENISARRENIAAFERAQMLRYGETLSRLRALVTLNVRGDVVPLADWVVASGSAEAFRKVQCLEGVAALALVPGETDVRG